jgi:hypothetical protein
MVIFAAACIIFFGGYWLYRKTVALMRRILILTLDIFIAILELLRWVIRCLFGLARHFQRDRASLSAKSRGGSLPRPLFYVSESGIQNAFHTVELRSPKFPQIIKSLVYTLEPLINTLEPLIDTLKTGLHPQD